MTLQLLVNENNGIQKNCEDKISRLSFWEQNFKDLEEAVTALAADLQTKYEQSVVQEDLPEDIRVQLENRREGIRLSAKSASRLLRKLDPEKRIQNGVYPIVTEEKLRADLSEINRIEQGKPLSELVEQFVTKTEPSENIQEPDESSMNKDGELNETNVEEAVLSEEADVEVTVTENGNPAENLEVEVEIVTQPEQEEPLEDVDITIDSTELTIPEEETMDVTAVSAETEKIQRVLEEAVKHNSDVLEDIQENLESVEKRFCNFVEKAVGPVMDGLHSGKKHGVSLAKEYQEAGIEESHQEGIAQWLTIYDEMLKPVTGMLEHFSVVLYEPVTGQPFDENTQEPIAVVEDSDFKDEDVKEVVRSGLQYHGEIFNQNSFLIRPAQVIVVKNSSAESVDEEIQAEGSTGE